MWFVGLVIGGLFGTAVGALVRWEEAWMLFAAIGAAGAIALKSEGAFSGKPVSEALERRIAALEREVQVLKAAHKAPATPAAAAAPPEASAPIETPEEAPASAPAVFEAAPVGVAPSTASAESHAEAAVASPHARDPLVMQTPAPKEPSWLAQKIFGGNILAKVGVVLLFFGIASGLKLAIDFGLFPASVRLLLATLAGIAMIGFGYTRTTLEKHRMFGLALQGGGFGVLYLVTYFALARYSFIDNATAFALFTALGIACLVVAVRLEGEPLAILGISGAFFAPLLASTGRGSHVVLFSFYAVLTVLVLGVNWLRAWRALTLTAFVFTLITGMTWASLRFERELFASTGAFLALFSVLFSGAAFASSFGRRATADHWADTVLLFGTPIAAAAAQSWLVERVGLGQTALAWSAVGAGLYYSALAAMLHARATAERARAAHAAIAVAFYTLAVPLAFGVQVTTAFWAIEGFVLAWFGVTRSRRFPYAAGLFLQLLAGGYFLFDWHDVRRMPVLNDTYVGCVVIAACGIATAWVTRRSKAGWMTGDWVTIFAAFAAAWALVWWLGANAAEIARFAAHVHKIALYVALLVATAWVLVAIGRTLSWPGARYVALVLCGIALLGGIFDGWSRPTGHPLHDSMIFALPGAFASFYLILRQHEREGLRALLSEAHVFALLTLAVTLLRETLWVADRLAPGVGLWHFLAWQLVPAGCVLAVVHLDRHRAWPVASERRAYLTGAALVLLGVALVAALRANFDHHGGGTGLPYLPFASYFDAAQIAVMFTSYAWAARAQPLMPSASVRLVRLLPVTLGFVWLSAMAMRLAHHWGGVPFEAGALLRSGMAQSMLSLLWTALALALMIGATRKLLRRQWFAGFALLGVVGAKFVLIDVVNKGTVTWTLSLIGVGLLILAASYFSPAPPKELNPA